ncbi:acyltransferase family protein, partial [Streptomyces sp. PRKS01-65]|nr:acyltransferase family protein [Streptomyces harenosi]
MPNHSTRSPAEARPESAAWARRLPSLTGLRFIAAFLVFLYHAAAEKVFSDPETTEEYAELVGKAGFVGVSFFFVLSGFVLTWSARPGDTLGRFWRRRLVKIYPNHLVTLLAALLLINWAGPLLPGGEKTSGLLPNLLLIHTWFPDPYTFISLNGVSWSLSCEVLFYLSFPLWAALIRRVRPERLWWGAGAAALAVILAPAVATALPEHPLLPWQPLPEYQYWFVYLFPPVRMLEFVLGIFLARIVQEGRWIGLRVPVAAALFVAGYALALQVPVLYGYAAATVVPVALLIPAAATADIDGTRSLLRGRTLVWLGEVSFAFYLVHRLVLMYGHRALGEGRTWPAAEAVALLALALAVALALAAALYHGVERPMMRRFASPRTTPAAPAP